MTKTTNHTKEGFVMVLNGIFELGLSTDALAIYCYMASKSPTWDYRPTEIKKTLQIGQSIWLRATGELKALGLYEVKPSKDGSQIVLNRFRGADIRKPDVGKPDVGKPDVGKSNPIVRLRSSKTNFSNTEDQEREAHTGKDFIPPTLEEIKDYMREQEYTKINPNKFLSKYISKGWMIGSTKMVDWKAAVTTWELNEDEFNGTKTNQQALNEAWASTNF